MRNDLGKIVKSVTLQGGLLGKKPKNLVLYEKGIVLHFKKNSCDYLFTEVAAIKTLDIFAPNPTSYSFDLFDVNNEKITSLDISYVQQTDAMLLLELHKRAVLGANFPADLRKRALPIDDTLSWDGTKLVRSGRKGIEEFSVEQIDAFVNRNGSFFFTFKESKETLLVGVLFSPNCLMAIEICRAIASLGTPRVALVFPDFEETQKLY